jgi:mRNA interferase HigB
MRIIARRTLREFADSHRRASDHAALKSALDTWFVEVSHAHWRSMATVKEQYRSASVISSDRLVFNIRSNAHRLVVAVDIEKSAVWIKWIGTHRDYDRIDARTIEHGR